MDAPELQSMESEPSTSEGNGRDHGGRFAAGNRLAKGNPHAKRVAKLRAVLFRAADPAAMLRAARKIMQQAEGGDLAAFREILDRTVGKTIASDVEERLTRLEQLLEQRSGQH